MSDYSNFMHDVFPKLNYDNQVRYQERLGILMDSTSEDVPDEIHKLAVAEITTEAAKEDNAPCPGKA